MEAVTVKLVSPEGVEHKCLAHVDPQEVAQVGPASALTFVFQRAADYVRGQLGTDTDFSGWKQALSPLGLILMRSWYCE